MTDTSCRKLGFETEAKARTALAASFIDQARGKTHRQEVRPYYCTRCTKWHLTSQPLRTSESEDQFLRWVVETAKIYRVLCAHVRPGMTQAGRWITAYTGDAGLPDLILMKDGHVELWELKSEAGTLEPSQKKWVDNGAKVFRPSDKPELLKRLASFGKS